MPEYRRLIGKNTWHWHKYCSHWPESKFSSLILPSGEPFGDLCSECRVKELIVQFNDMGNK
ncbi:MAG: hypothetical protein FD174_1674 [Geobacteraceae bacterium]|nr:MAG: hypothetical protein FD174_1674 [Geobacteraceae bacterium]